MRLHIVQIWVLCCSLFHVMSDMHALSAAIASPESYNAISIIDASPVCGFMLDTVACHAHLPLF